MSKQFNSGKKRGKSTGFKNECQTFTKVSPLNYIQSEYLNCIRSSEVIFGVGSAGTGKTYLAANFAASELFYRNVSKIILTRPNVEVGRGMGFLPGELDEKYAPYLEPFDHVFTESLGRGFYEYALKSKAIEAKPLGFMRGISFNNAIILADEMQNATVKEMKMLLSRIGDNCKLIISGDTQQVDINDSGLEDAINRVGHINGISVVEFLDEDIVRSKMCKQVILAYNK